MNLWDDMEHAVQNLNRVYLLLQDEADTIDKKNGLLDLQMRISELEDTIEVTRVLFE